MTRAVVLDALGTLVRLEPPGPRLRDELARRGIDVSVTAAERAFAAEIAYYLEHHLEGRDAASLDALRDRCAAVLATALGVGDVGVVRAAMLAAIRFEAYPDAAAALRELRRAGLRLVVASNWDCSLASVLGVAGLRDLVDGVVSSAQAGAAKPAPAVVERALGIAGVEAREAVFVGDSVENDLAAGRAAGVRLVLLVREGDPPPGVETLRSLAELPGLVAPART